MNNFFLLNKVLYQHSTPWYLITFYSHFRIDLFQYLITEGLRRTDGRTNERRNTALFIIYSHSFYRGQYIERNSMDYFYLILLSINAKLHIIYLLFMQIFGSILSVFSEGLWHTDGRVSWYFCYNIDYQSMSYNRIAQCIHKT